MVLNEQYDCLSCGACCYGKRDYVQVFTHDAVRLGPARMEEFVALPIGEAPASVGRAAEPVRFMKMTDGHCKALCTTTPKRFECSVYENRPTLCRALEPGSGPCLEARVRLGIDPPR